MIGRRRGDYPPYPGDAGRDHAHMRRGHHGIATAGHITTGRIDGDIFMPEDHARQGLHLHIPQGPPLMFGKIADLRLRKLNIRLDLGGHLRITGPDLRLAQAESLRTPAVKLLGIMPQGGITPFSNISQNRLNGLPDLGVSNGRLCPALAGL